MVEFSLILSGFVVVCFFCVILRNTDDVKHCGDYELYSQLLNYVC